MRCTTQPGDIDPAYGHDWVLVSFDAYAHIAEPGIKLLWACPCGEFRWTSYTEWESRQQPNVGVDWHPQSQST